MAGSFSPSASWTSRFRSKISLRPARREEVSSIAAAMARLSVGNNAFANLGVLGGVVDLWLSPVRMKKRTVVMLGK